MAEFSRSKKLDKICTGPRLLWDEPPMAGILQHYAPKNTTIIVSNGMRILFRESNFYVNGQKCPKGALHSIRESGANVNFEACVFHSPFLNPPPHEIRHRADLVWVGQKPSLATIAQSIGKVDPGILSDPSKTFVGLVDHFYFPDTAILKIKRDQVNSIVCLSTQSFATAPARVTLGNRSCILDYCVLRDYMEFKIRANLGCPLGACAYDAKVLSKEAYRSTPNTSQHFQNKLKKSVGNKFRGQINNGNQPGGDQSGGSHSGGNEPVGNEPGGSQPGGSQSGGNHPGGNHPGGNRFGKKRFGKNRKKFSKNKFGTNHGGNPSGGHPRGSLPFGDLIYGRNY